MSPKKTQRTLTPPFNLLELTLISAQDLLPSPRSLHTYAVTFLHPSRRLRTRPDSSSPASPTWNDKFLFRVDHPTFHSDTSAIQIDVYSSSRPRLLPSPDTLLGTSRALLSTLRLSSSTRFLALQIRRPNSLRPQGILNIGVGIVSPYVCGLPLYANLRTSGFAYRDLMREADSRRLKKWRSESWAGDDGEVASRKGGMRRQRAMSCFNLAGRVADEVEEEEEEGSSRSSWSSSSQR